MLLFDGFVLIMLGVLGEYIGRIYDETKGRPLYIVNEVHGIHHQEEQLPRERITKV
ncbi:putative glycosyltransferase CsbB [compost metagenome]